MTVRSKFKVSSIKREKHWDERVKSEIQTIELHPVTGGSPENQAFFDSTPSGSIHLGTVNEESGKTFELGAEYYIDFTKAE